MYSMASPTVVILSASSSGISMENSSASRKMFMISSFTKTREVRTSLRTFNGHDYLYGIERVKS